MRQLDCKIFKRKAPISQQTFWDIWLANCDNLEIEDDKIPFIFVVLLKFLKIHKICIWVCWRSTILFSRENSLSFLWFLLILQATFQAIGNLKM